MDIRKILGIDENYSTLNREERNYAAIFFAALCKPESAKNFLSQCGYDDEIGKDFGIYFEYSHLRDLWFAIKDEEKKREIIRTHLQIADINSILSMPTKEVNRYFGVAGEPSDEYIQFPGKWAIVKYNKNIQDDSDFLKICRFKWSFNIKPDIVIHLNRSKALCIEAKFESREGSYPSSEIEKGIFKKRELAYVGQMDLQKYMMNDLLGIETEFIYLVYKNEKSRTHKIISWGEAFSMVDLSDMPSFVKEMAAKISS